LLGEKIYTVISKSDATIKKDIFILMILKSYNFTSHEYKWNRSNCVG